METPASGGGAAFMWHFVARGSIPTHWFPINRTVINASRGWGGDSLQVNAWRAFNYCNYKSVLAALTLMWRLPDIKGRTQQIKAQSWLIGVAVSSQNSHKTDDDLGPMFSQWGRLVVFGPHPRCFLLTLAWIRVVMRCIAYTPGCGRWKMWRQRALKEHSSWKY